MPFSGPREDREAIHELYASAADAGACGDKEAFVACFAEDGEWTTSFFSRKGRAAIAAQWDELWLGFEKVGIIVQVGSIEVEGDSAASRCLVQETVVLKAGALSRLTGLYRDRLVRIQGKWMFASRTFESIAQETPA